MTLLRPRSDARRVAGVLDRICDRHASGLEGLLALLVDRLGRYYRSIVRTASGDERRPRLIVGLSGGLDSSLVAAIAAGAAGSDAVTAVTIIARPDDRETIEMADRVRAALLLRGQPSMVSIEKAVDALESALNEAYGPESSLSPDRAARSLDDKIRAGNLASRMRVSVLYDIARATRGRVLGTANRPEILVGYAAKFGTPISYDLGVLDDLYKVEIRRLAAMIGLPSAVRERVPTTGYFAGQSHEDELGATHEELDACCFLLFDQRVRPRALVDDYGIAEDVVRLVLRRYRASAHKRRLWPSHIRIEPKARRSE